MININEIFSLNDIQANSLDDNSNINRKGPNLNQNSDDIASFDELMQSYQNQNEAETTSPENNASVVSTDEKPTKKVKDNKTVDNNLDKSPNINGLIYYSYVQDINTVQHKSKLNTDSLKESDISFITNTLNNPNINIAINHINPQNLQINFTNTNPAGEVSYTSENFSKKLFDLIGDSYKNQKPFRLDFDGNSSVILKIDKEGKLSAEFIAGSEAMENLLKGNLQNLRNKLDSQGIAYKEITYRDNNKKQNQKENKGE